ncbi:MAG: efflux RND transporter permease subunit [Proteobacteria bacterium]|nr:efflux RND transporter permease subunit [Pseudomonadota bacterium]NOG59844.1 efflux RND transporter permease subunit [Pseudomonadota bacterium]
MLQKIIQFALTQRLLIMMSTVILAIAGWKAFQNLPIDAFPDVSTTQVKIIIKAPGMTPEEVETRITAPIEVEMLGIPKQSMLRSMSKYALADITVDFADGTDIYWARQQVSERLNAIWSDLPADIGGGIAPMTTPLGEMFMFTIESDELSIMEKRTLLDWVIRPALRTVPGVADVNALGGLVRTFEVTPNITLMNNQGITLDALRAALLENNRNDGAGQLIDGEETLLIRSDGSIQTLDDIGDIIVKSHPVEPVRIRDIATISIGSLTRYGGVTRNGKGEAVEGLVLGLRGANARKLVAGVSQKLDELQSTLPEGVTTRVFYNRGDLVDSAVNTVAKALAEAIVLVLILLVLFLGNLRAALTVALILPLAALATVILMRQFNLSANLMSLGGLAIAIGMLVDAAVVIVENVVSELAHKQKTNLVPRLHLIYRSVADVALPVTTGIIVIMVVFLPLLTLQGLEGKLFSPVAITIVFALGASLLLSLTVIPVLSSVLLKNVSHKDPFLVKLLDKLYTPILKRCLQYSWAPIALALFGLIVMFGLYTQLGKSFMPTLDEGNIIVQTEKLPSIDLNESMRIDTMVQKAILGNIPEVTGIVARTGSDEIGLDPMGLNQTDMFLEIKPREEWSFKTKDEFIEKLRNVLSDFPGLVFGFTQPIEMRVSEMLTGVRGDVAIKLFGNDLNTLNEKAQKIASVVEKVQGAEDVFAAQNEGVQYLRVVIDRLAVGRLGLSIDDVENTLRSLIEGQNIGIIYESSRRIPLIIKGRGDLRQSADEFTNLRLTLDDGRSIPLTSLATLERVEGPVMITRETGSRSSVVIANVGGRDLVGFVDEVKQQVADKVQLPTGYYLKWGGQFENQQRAAARFAIVIPAAIGLIFLLLFSTFRSVSQSILILTNIPFAMIGGVVALWISGEYLSVPASVGFIALLGIAVLNGVVLVTFFNQLRELGHDINHVVIEGARRRLRPVMMTASIAAFSLIPLLFATGPGSEIQRPLAIVVIGGLVTSTMLTLLILPVLYRWLHR